MTPEEQYTHPEFKISSHNQPIDLGHESMEEYWSHCNIFARDIFQILGNFEFKNIVNGIKAAVILENAAHDSPIEREKVEHILKSFLQAADKSVEAVAAAISKNLDEDLTTTRLILSLVVTDIHHDFHSEFNTHQSHQEPLLRIEPATLHGVRIEEIYSAEVYYDEDENGIFKVAELPFIKKTKISDRVLVIQLYAESLIVLLEDLDKLINKTKDQNGDLLKEDIYRLKLILSENLDDLMRIAQMNHVLCSSLETHSKCDSINRNLRNKLDNFAQNLSVICRGICFEFESEITQKDRKAVISQKINDFSKEQEDNDDDNPLRIKIVNIDPSVRWPEYIEDRVPDFWEESA